MPVAVLAACYPPEKFVKKCSGADVEESVGIIVNRNVIPREDENHLSPSGVRLGSTSITVRGMGETEAMGIVDLID